MQDKMTTSRMRPSIESWQEADPMSGFSSSSMKVKAGVWIDHRKALIVLMTAGGERTMAIASHVEKHLQRSGDSPLRGRYEAQKVPADDCREKVLTAELNIFYDAVIGALRSAESYIILGPGEAKGELKRRLLKHDLGGRLAAIMVADKMTDRQIAARVREHFSAPWLAKGPRTGRANAGLRGETSRAPIAIWSARAPEAAQRSPVPR
jgi:hypothetical protein